MKKRLKTERQIDFSTPVSDLFIILSITAQWSFQVTRICLHFKNSYKSI